MKLRALLILIVLLLAGPLLSAQELKKLHTLKGHSSGCYSVAFAADGKTLASGTGNGWVKLWEVATGRELASFPVREKLGENLAFPLHWLAFTPDGKTLASAWYTLTASQAPMPSQPHSMDFLSRVML